MQQHLLHVQPVFFNMIQDGTKTIELRLWDEKRRKINIGDEIIFQKNDSDETITTRVNYLVVAQNFSELFKMIDVKDAGFENTEIAQESIEQYFSKEAQEQNGVVGIGITALVVL